VGSDTILTSADGTNWVERSVRTSSGLQLITYGNGQFVAVEWQGAIVTSTDGVHWTERLLGTNESLTGISGIAYGKGRFVATSWFSRLVDDFGRIQTSVDGVNWVEVAPTTALLDVAFGNGQFVAVGRHGTILTSADGISWEGRRSGASPWLTGITYGDGSFVAVGEGGAILQSGPIITVGLAPIASAGLVRLSADGPTGAAYTVQRSTDLISWKDLTNVIAKPAGNATVDLPFDGSGSTFYRAYSQ
jgi:hypothetical protein